GLQFATKFLVVKKGGSILNYDNQIIIKGADELVVYYAASTDYYGHDPLEYIEKQLAGKLDYAALKKKHLAKYKEVFDRVTLNINDQNPQHNRPTDIRLSYFYENHGQDNRLSALYYQDVRV